MSVLHKTFYNHNKNFLLTDTRTGIIYALDMGIALHGGVSVIGFSLFLAFFSQLLSGTIISFGYITDCMLVPSSRNEEASDDLYADDFFWLHERGVDIIFLFSYIHFLRKFFLLLQHYEYEIQWKSGIFVFLFLQVVVFLGLVLCCTHLSEITLTIASNILHTFVLFYGRIYWWLFTDRQLNTDTITRLSYLHYITAFILFYFAILHGGDMHFDWKSETFFDGILFEIAWLPEAVWSEIGFGIKFFIYVKLCSFYYYKDLEPLNFELFMWGDVGYIKDQRTFGVAPHWYFRPFMAWLLVCPFHKTGIFGLILFFFLLYYQPNIRGVKQHFFFIKFLIFFLKYIIVKKNFFWSFSVPIYSNVYYQNFFWLFFMALLYTTSMLPYGRFYNRLQGNDGMLFSYFFVFYYLSFCAISMPNVFLYIFDKYNKHVDLVNN